MQKARIGCSRQIINPTMGTRLAGFDYERYAEGIHDNLYARVIVIEKQEVFVLVQLDLLGVDKYFVDLLSNSLAQKYEIKEKNVLVSCIHTHSGPAGTKKPITPKDEGSKDKPSFFDNALAEYIIRQITSGVSESLENLSRFTISYRKSKLRGIGLNRRAPSMPIDDELQVLIFNREDSKKIIIYNYACHPTVMNHLNNQVTADYPGEAARLLESQDDIACAAFYNGECGDVSTRFTRLESSFSEVKRIGDILGGEVLKLISQRGSEEEVENVRVKSLPVELKTKKLMKPEEARHAMEKAKAQKEEAEARGLRGGDLRLYQSVFEGAVQNLRLAESIGNVEKIGVEVKVLQIDDRYIVYIPGELFTTLGIMLKNKFKESNILISCYSNGYAGYIPDIQAYGEDGYETLSTKFAAGQGEKLIDEISCLIASMKGDKLA